MCWRCRELKRLDDDSILLRYLPYWTNKSFEKMFQALKDRQDFLLGDNLAYDITKEKMMDQEIDRRAEAKPEALPPEPVPDASETPPDSEASVEPTPPASPGVGEGGAPEQFDPTRSEGHYEWVVDQGGN